MDEDKYFRVIRNILMGAIAALIGFLWLLHKLIF